MSALQSIILLAAAAMLIVPAAAMGAFFDAAPFALPLPEGNGLMREDPREIHHVVVHFKGPPPAADQVKLQY